MAQCTNRQPADNLLQMLIGVQIILAQRKVRVKESMAAQAASRLAQYKGTIIPKSFISKRMHSWQAHLQRSRQ